MISSDLSLSLQQFREFQEFQAFKQSNQYQDYQKKYLKYQEIEQRRKRSKRNLGKQNSDKANSGINKPPLHIIIENQHQENSMEQNSFINNLNQNSFEGPMINESSRTIQ